MKKLFSPLLHKFQNHFHPMKGNRRYERGQILIIVTLSVIGLVAAVGLTVDTGLLYLNHGKLRRAVDAAALAASAQFREGYSIDDLQKAAKEFLILNGVNDPSAVVETCESTGGTDPVLCQKPLRKLVRIKATSVMKLAFLPVIGIDHTTVSAQAVSEAASMDVVLVIDASESMTYDAPVGDALRDPSQCNPIDDCHPFKEVKTAAKAFVDQLYFPYDRVAVVSFDDGAKTALSFSDKRVDVENAIDALKVFDPGVCPTASGPCREYQRYLDTDPVYGNNNGNYFDEPFIDANGDGKPDTYVGFDCPVYRSTGNPDTCPSTAIGQGLLFAGNEFGNKDTFREDSLWVVILLTDGAANAPAIVCPNNTWTNPFCRDLSATSRHCFQPDATYCLDAGGVYWPERYDADDYARDMADFVAKDQGALIFTIGLGPLVQNSEPLNANGEGAGEQLMKYAAEVGKGKYYYAPGGNQLRDIFLDIAQYLATRLTQ